MNGLTRDLGTCPITDRIRETLDEQGGLRCVDCGCSGDPQRDLDEQGTGALRETEAMLAEGQERERVIELVRTTLATAQGPERFGLGVVYVLLDALDQARRAAVSWETEVGWWREPEWTASEAADAHYPDANVDKPCHGGWYGRGLLRARRERIARLVAGVEG